MPTNTASLDGTVIKATVTELVEDGIGEIVKHHQKAGLKNQTSKFKLEMVITQDKNGELFTISFNHSLSLAPKSSVTRSFYGSVDRHGVPQVAEYNPRQMRMFAESESPADAPTDKT